MDGQEHKISEKDIIHAEDQQILSIENNGDTPLSVYVVLARG